MKQTFSVTLKSDGSFELPIDVRALYGEARPAVQMTLLGQTIRTRVMVYGGKFFLALRKKLWQESGARGGDTCKVTIEPDRAPRTVTPPKELAALLKKNATARAAWSQASFTQKREWTEAINGAKKLETRERRLALILAALVKKSAKKRG